MKIFRLLILSFLFMLYKDHVKAQLIPISLEQRIDNASFIFEGKVLSQASYWDSTKTHIYTANMVEVYKVFKGTSTKSQVQIITRGGKVGNIIEKVSHTLVLNVGDIGIFTAVPNTSKVETASTLEKMKAYAGIQGFIRYDLKNGTANDIFNTYKSITNSVYKNIADKTKTEYKVIKEAPFKSIQ